MEKRLPDERIVKLSYAKFEEEFGFRPEDKTEQKFFALRGRRPDPRILFALQHMEAVKAAKVKEA